MIDKDKVKELLITGKTLREVGSILGCTAANVGMLARNMGLQRTQFGSGKKKKDKYESLVSKREMIYGRTNWGLDDLGRARSAAFLRKRQSAKSGGKYEWDLEAKDIQWPTHCPILGIELDYFCEVRSENSPSFDRIDSTKGYVKGNVHVISWRANRIKNDGTKEEHYKIYKFLCGVPS